MHDALDIRTALRYRAAAITAAPVLRRSARRLFPREAFDDWENVRDRGLAPA